MGRKPGTKNKPRTPDVPAVREAKVMPREERQEEQRGVMSIDAEALLRQAVDKNLPVETMQRLLDMRKQLKDEWAREQYFKALSGFQKECPIIKKESKVDFESARTGGRTKYNYASLDEIVKQTKDLLERWGFSYTTKTKQTHEQVTAIVCAHHVDGHTEESEFSITIDKGAKMNLAQQEGSALTYATRYAFRDVFGIVTGDEDDDAQSTGGQNGTNSTNGSPRVTPNEPKVPRPDVVNPDGTGKVASTAKTATFRGAKPNFTFEKRTMSDRLTHLRKSLSEADFTTFETAFTAGKDAKAQEDVVIEWETQIGTTLNAKGEPEIF